MQYENIILELMSRIKTLESDVAYLKENLASFNSLLEKQEIQPENNHLEKSKVYTRMTDKMIDACYKYGKKAFETSDEYIKEYAANVSNETGMNKNSAIMYIYAVKSLLQGSVYKRAINSTALKKYFVMINDEFGKNGLEKALNATEKHIEYLTKFNIPTKSISKIYDEFKRKIL